MHTNTNKISLWDRIMMAITFAEANDGETAREMLDEQNWKETRANQKVRKETGKRPELRV